ncbi:PAS domain S-box protein [Aquabacterium sp. OR-4]|uniref:PAS domain S-box protein n=1 Tax=Aquabacterium sp. OR-4 TaxID=2978127 RepID=UPI0021B39408|nr:PAS domain S-box protein [Aquabacterium sp. OR-4]MDT7836183.1 PAS domain S-box protein [Aquabacterium sp. OR-4]
MALLARPVTLPSNAQLTALLDGVAEVLVLLDVRQRVAWCNKAATRLLGCEPGQAAAEALERLQAAAREALLAALQAGRPEALLSITLTDGPTLPFTLARNAGSGWVLRAPLEPPPPPLPPLAAGATTELVRLLWDTPQPLLVQDEQFVSVAANRAFYESLGLPPEQLLGHDLLSLMPQDDHAAVQQGRAELLQDLHAGRRPTLKLERRLIDAHGRVRWFRHASLWVSADDGRPLLLALLQDVTPEYQARQQAEHSGNELEHWFDLSPIGMLVYDAEGLVVRSNTAFEALVGHTPVLLHDAPADLTQLLAWEGDRPHPELRPDAPPLEVMSTVRLPPGPGAPEGRRQRLRARLRAFRNEQGRLRVMAVVEDRSLEDEHDLAQLEIGALMDTAGVGVATYEASRGWLKSRPARGGGPVLAGAAGAGMAGAGAAGGLGGGSSDGGAGVAAGGAASGAASPAAPQHGAAPVSGLPAGLQSIGREQVAPASREAFERLQRALREGQRAQVRYAVQMPDASLRWLLTRVEPGELTGGRTALSVVTLDVTEQEEAHQRSQQLLRELSTILEGTSAGIAYLRGEQLVRCNHRFEAMLGLAAGQAAGSRLPELLAEQPEARQALRRALDGEARQEIEMRQPSALPGAAPVWLALSVSRALAETAAGEPELVLVLTDVTRLKAQQAELEALARERALMFSLSDVGVAYLRHDRIERANEALAELTGYTVHELEQLPLAVLFEDADSQSRLADEQRQALQAAGLWRGERRLRRRDGRLLWVQVSKRRVDEADPEAGLICSYVDVDERRRAREAVQLQAERTRAILDSVLVGIVTVGDGGGIEWMNRSARRMFGGELADFVGEPIAIVATAEPDHPLRATHYLQALADGQAETFECKLRGRDGREFWVVGNAVVTGREGSRSTSLGPGSQITFALLDIERRRQAEVSIAQAQASLQRIIETAPLAIALFEAGSGRVLRLNQMAAMFFGRPVEAVLGQPPERWFASADATALHADLAHALQGGPDGLRREWPRPSRADGEGETRVWDMRIVSLGAPGGGGAAEAQLLLVASDVTEQRAAEQARFEAAIAQREMLVKEVHHRIKNNLQGVAGLLQQTAARRPEVADLIGEAVGQVQAIAQVHGLQVGASGPLRIKPLLEAVTASVQRTFGRAIGVVVAGTPPHRFALPEAESIPIALTVNELLTNAVKHGTAGEIRCVLTCDEARLAIAIYSPGQLREGFSLAQVPPGVSGLGLVRALLPRRSATLTLSQAGVEVEAKVVLVPPSIYLLEPI